MFRTDKSFVAKEDKFIKMKSSLNLLIYFVDDNIYKHGQA